jgi:hypothetical protein
VASIPYFQQEIKTNSSLKLLKWLWKLTHHYSVKPTANLILRAWMEREELLHDDVFVLRAEAFAVSVSVGRTQLR